MPTLKQILKSKTMLFGLLITILGIVQDNVQGLSLSPEHQSLALMAIGIVVAVLRFITSVPLNQK